MSSHNSAPLNSVKYILRWGAEYIGISWYIRSLVIHYPTNISDMLYVKVELSTP